MTAASTILERLLALGSDCTRHQDALNYLALLRGPDPAGNLAHHTPTTAPSTAAAPSQPLSADPHRRNRRSTTDRYRHTQLGPLTNPTGSHHALQPTDGT
ncbi:hypothetical protein [Streptomyces sp. H39-S7]|uniref:hypothetical protein n=1 Tax=Streptomyces sp. H39-S7 TaxID=3004357 RepID=UPI0022AEAC33|nr:hypothetical protein [Streptomyces sp. H39-S7]MCZ4124130.1 hypothetical protein [Streptomyces sp. H39-S7]